MASICCGDHKDSGTIFRDLVHDNLEGHRSHTIASTAAVDDVLGPSPALDVQHLALGRGDELHGDQRTQVAWLVHERIVVVGESHGGVVIDVRKVLLVLAQMTIAAHPHLFPLEKLNFFNKKIVEMD